MVETRTPELYKQLRMKTRFDQQTSTRHWVIFLFVVQCHATPSWTGTSRPLPQAIAKSGIVSGVFMSVGIQLGGRGVVRLQPVPNYSNPHDSVPGL